MIKKILPLILFLTTFSSAQQLINLGEAKGFFMSIGIGPKVPIGSFSQTNNVGVGFDVTFSYTDNKVLPIFFYTKFGYQHYPGDQTLYRTTDYSAFSTNGFLIAPGFRYFLPPIIDQDFLLMPILEVGLSWEAFVNSHVFKIDSGQNNFEETKSKFGFHIGAGFSMFVMDVMGNYYFFNNNQYLSFDLRIRIPIFVNI